MNPFILAAWITCQSLDATTTAVALARPTLTEANPIMAGSRGIPLRVSINLSAVLLARRATRPQRHVIGVALATSGCSAGAWNLHQLGSEFRGRR